MAHITKGRSMAMPPLRKRTLWEMQMLSGGCGNPVMSYQDTGTGQDVTNRATGGTIENARATQTKYCSSQQKKRD
eukprot:12897021-Ditylum_brightwellii.AAC.1